jgi:predicted kinase
VKKVIALVGPKGAGKSTIGRFLAAESGIRFLDVEPLFLEVRARLGASHPDCEHRGFEMVLAGLTDALTRSNTVCFDSTGASTHFHWLLSELGKLALVVPVRVLVDLAQCVERIHGRDAAVHIPVVAEHIERINAVATQVELPWAAEIDNRGEFNGALISDIINRALQSCPGATRGE